ncbi:MAG: hypothetical protein ABR924_20530 [Terracidiphilus sp.]|jgi:hypothetical protein
MNDYRQDAFKAKFATAARAMGVTPKKIASLKLRDTVNSYHEYRDLIRSLEVELGFHCSAVAGDLQGRGHLLTKEKAEVILVEHESGLEILYIAGSVASLIGLIPMILQAWNALRRFSNPGNPFQSLEVRRFNENGELKEDTVHLNRHGLGEASNMALTVAAGLLEDEFQRLTRQVESVSPQIAALEQRLAKVEAALKVPKPSTRKPKLP